MVKDNKKKLTKIRTILVKKPSGYNWRINLQEGEKKLRG